MNALNVYFRDTHCARLTQDASGRPRFQYLDSWLQQGKVPVSLTLPLGDEVYTADQVTPFIANLLPQGRDLRDGLERLLQVELEDDFGLLCAIGRECAGAISFWPEGESPQDNEPRYSQLNVAEFHQWCEFAHQVPFQPRGRTLKISLAGEHAKTALYFDSQDICYLPENGASTSHILKPGIQGRMPDTAHTEYLTMKLARVVLGDDEVPAVDLWQNCYRIRRFDRPLQYHKPRRLHQEDFCLALGRMPARKYESRHAAEHLLGACFHFLDLLGEQGLVAAPAIERQRLLNQVILNVLLHNPDAHLKNYALMLQDNGKICVTPLYGSLYTPNRNMSLRIGNALIIDQIGEQDWQQFAIECGFTATFVRRRVRKLAGTVSDVLPLVIGSVLAEYPMVEQASEAVRVGVTQQVKMATNPSFNNPRSL